MRVIDSKQKKNIFNQHKFQTRKINKSQEQEDKLDKMRTSFFTNAFS